MMRHCDYDGAFPGFEVKIIPTWPILRNGQRCAARLRLKDRRLDIAEQASHEQVAEALEQALHTVRGRRQQAIATRAANLARWRQAVMVHLHRGFEIQLCGKGGE